MSVESVRNNFSRFKDINHDSKVHGANMGPIWGRQDPGGPHVSPMNFAIWEVIFTGTVMKLHYSFFFPHDFLLVNDAMNAFASMLLDWKIPSILL